LRSAKKLNLWKGLRPDLCWGKQALLLLWTYLLLHHHPSAFEQLLLELRLPLQLQPWLPVQQLPFGLPQLACQPLPSVWLLRLPFVWPLLPDLPSV